jgi:hypothetical protein
MVPACRPISRAPGRELDNLIQVCTSIIQGTEPKHHNR